MRKIVTVLLIAFGLPASALADEPTLWDAASHLGVTLSVQDVACEGGEFGGEWKPTPGVIDVEFHSAGLSFTTTMDPCRRHQQVVWRGRGWLARLVSSPRWDWPHVRIEMAPKRTATQRFSFEFRVGDVPIASGRLRIRNRYSKATRIWEGSDGFINYCIAETRPLRSSGGRLFCTEPGFNFVRYQLDRAEPLAAPWEHRSSRAPRLTVVGAEHAVMKKARVEHGAQTMSRDGFADCRRFGRARFACAYGADALRLEDSMCGVIREQAGQDPATCPTELRGRARVVASLPPRVTLGPLAPVER